MVISLRGIMTLELAYNKVLAMGRWSVDQCIAIVAFNHLLTDSEEDEFAMYIKNDRPKRL